MGIEIKGKSPILLKPSQVLKKLNLECPITSVRRALTNLTNEDKIIKTDVKVVGLYGKKEHLWRLKTAQDDIDPDQYSLFQYGQFNTIYKTYFRVMW